MRSRQGTLGRKKGKRAERLFARAWQECRPCVSWIRFVRVCTRREDAEKTDAVLYTTYGEVLRIQIKSYTMRSGEEDALVRYGVVPVSVLRGESALAIQKKTLAAIVYFRQRRLEMGKPPRTKPMPSVSTHAPRRHISGFADFRFKIHAPRQR